MRAVSMADVGQRRWTGSHTFWWVVSGALAGGVTAALPGVLWLACLGWLVSGLALGLAQGYVLRRSGIDVRGWTLVTVVAALAVVLLFGLFNTGLITTGTTLGQRLKEALLAGALAGFTLGLCQYALLRPECRGAAWWIAASALAGAAGSVAANLVLWYVYGPVMITSGPLGPALLAAGLLQGALYGAVTAAALPGLLLRQPRRSYAPH
jgi:hypothetical protein